MVQPAKIEREVKLSVSLGYQLPDLSAVIDGTRIDASEDQHLDAVYYDTAQLRLLRRAVTLRFRRGEPPGDVWTVKLPAQPPVLGLSRREITMPGGGSSIPETLADLVLGWALGSPLTPVARLQTLRRRATLTSGKGQPVALLDDDEVSILRGSGLAARFRELEVELADDAPDGLLPRLAEALQATGAQPVDQVPKIVRALGPPALAPWELTVPELGARPTTAEVVRAGLLAAAARFIDHWAAVVLDEDPEGVHQARVGIRRLRSDMRTFERLLDGDNLRPVRDDLRWLASELGAVRDVDVLLANLRADAQWLQPDDRLAAEELLARLAGQRATAYTKLREAMRTARCAKLLQSVAGLVAAPPFASPDAEKPALEIVPTLVRRPLRRLRRETERLGKAPDDAALHRVRILAKRLRYATDASIPFGGKPARRAAHALGHLQDVLGDHNDACVALTRLRGLTNDATPSTIWTTGLLAGLQLARAADCRERFPTAYKTALAKKHWSWIT